VAETGGSENFEAKATSVESSAKDLLNEVSGTSDLASLLPDYPEITSTINYNQELKNVEKGVFNIKNEILSTHNQLEDIFNEYDVVDADTENNENEKKLHDDITKLLKSKFFKKSNVEDVPSPDLELDLDTDDI